MNGKENTEYQIKFSPNCLIEIENICNYINVVLRAEKASNKLRSRIIDKVIQLKYSPKIYTEIGKTDKLKRVYRRIVIGNYIILYTIIEEDKVVLISHMYYSGKNYLEELL